MSPSKSQVYLSVFILCHLTSFSCVFGSGNNRSYPLMNVLHIGDYIEAVTTVSAACANSSTSAATTTDNLLNEFSSCLSKISGKKATQFLGQFATICNHQFEYMPCWETLRNDTIKKCGNEPLVPGLYVTPVIAICASDLGEKKIGEMSTPENEREVKEKCPEVKPTTFEGFPEHCQDFLVDIASPKFCTRSKAIRKCVDKLFSMVCVEPLPTVINVYKSSYGNLTGITGKCDD